jgi:hypothetical protein
LRSVAIFYANKKKFLFHLLKLREEARKPLLFLAATAAIVATANTAGFATIGIFLNVCVHGFTFAPNPLKGAKDVKK